MRECHTTLHPQEEEVRRKGQAGPLELSVAFVFDLASFPMALPSPQFMAPPAGKHDGAAFEKGLEKFKAGKFQAM